MATKNHDEKHFESILRSLEKNFGEGFSARPLADVQLKAIPTGHDDLDCLLTRGAHGIYKGGICELMGSEGSGKTSIALRTVGHAQRMGGRCCWFDCESAFDERLAELNGVELGKDKIYTPELTELVSEGKGDSLSLFNVNEVLEQFYQAVASNGFDVVVLDSVAGLAPERILADDFHKDPDKAGVAEVARSMSQMLRKIAPACKKTETLAIFINQLRDQPGAYMQNRFHTPGGRALKFFAHQRISVEKINGVKGEVTQESPDGGKPEVIGHYAKCTIVKNKKAPPVQPGTVIEVPIYYTEYFPDDAKKCYDLARKLQVITIRNGTLTWKDSNKILLTENGESAVLAKIREDKLESQLAAACIDAAKSDRNQKLKNPVKVPTTLQQLAEKKVPAKNTTSSKRKPPAIDLNDEDT